MNRGSSFDLHKSKVSHRFIVNCRKRKDFVIALRNSVKTMQDKGFGIVDAWDLVIDFICYEPPHAADCSSGLNGICKLFVMISTDSIYEVCTRPTYLDPILGQMNQPQSLTAPQEAPISHGSESTTTHPGRREEDQALLPISDKELRKKDEYGLEKLQCEQVFLQAAMESTQQPSKSSQVPYPFETVWLRLPDVTGERELPRNRHFQLQMRVQLGLPIYIDPESNHYDVDMMGLSTFYDPGSSNGVINRLPAVAQFPVDAAKLSFVHARDVSTAILACHRLQQLALAERNEQQNTMGDDYDGVCGKEKPGREKSFLKSWSAVVNTGVNIGSLEQVTLLEYLYIIGNTLGKPVFVYGSHNGREMLLKQRIKALTELRNNEKSEKSEKNNKKGQNDHQNCQQNESKLLSSLSTTTSTTTPLTMAQFSNRVYPKSYYQLYLEYFTAHFNIASDSSSNATNANGTIIPSNAATNPDSISPGRESNRPNLEFFHAAGCKENNAVLVEKVNKLTKLTKIIDEEALHKLNQLTLDDVLPFPRPNPNQTNKNSCPVCSEHLPAGCSSCFQPTPWNLNENPSNFLQDLLDAGYTCPLESTTDSSDPDSSSSDSDDSDLDDFFAGAFAKTFTAPLLAQNNTDDAAKKLSRKAKIALVVKQSLAKTNEASEATSTTTMLDMSAQPSPSFPIFDPCNLDHLKALHLLERLETSDQCSYLPSVTQGPISIQKAMDHLPNWTPTCLYSWASKQTLWYSSTSTFMNAMDADPRNMVWELDQKWRKWFGATF